MIYDVSLFCLYVGVSLASLSDICVDVVCLCT
jgi:hypothetical protein